MLKGELTNLRPVTLDDHPLVSAWFNDPAAMRQWGMPGRVTAGRVLEEVQGWIEDARRSGIPVAFIIEELNAGPIGLLLLTDWREAARSADLSIVIPSPADQDRGLGTDALGTLFDTAFTEWNLHTVTARVEETNPDALRLYLRLGFRVEATLRDATFQDGTFHDQASLRLHAVDWLQEEP